MLTLTSSIRFWTSQFRYWELLETRSAAILLLLKDRGMARDEQLGPYLEEAANASNVKWVAARLRMKSVL